jgi:group I intron endonuclease
MTRRAHNSEFPRFIEFEGNLFQSPTQLFREVKAKPAVSLETFRNRLSRHLKANCELSEEVIQEALYLTASEFKVRYGVRKTWVEIEDVKIEAKAYYDENQDRAGVCYKTFRSRVAQKNHGTPLNIKKFEDALRMIPDDWRTFYGGGRHREFVYYGSEYPEQHGKTFHGISAFLKTIGRYDEKHNIWNRLKLGWDIDHALSSPLSRSNYDGIIYKITRKKTGQIYIGLSNSSLESRWKWHCNAAFKGKASNIFARAIREDGADGFSFETLEKGIKSDGELSNRENHWIDVFEARGENGMNTAKGGGLGSRRGKIVEYKGKRFSSITEAGEVLGKRYGLNSWIVTTRLSAGKALPKKARVHSNHPDAGTNLFRRWLGLKKRHPVDISDDWLNDYDLFKGDVAKDYVDGLELVRVDPAKPWGKLNCKWVTTQEKVEQVHGKGLTCNEDYYPSFESLARAYGIGTSTLKDRIKRQGMSPEDAVKKSVRKPKPIV